MLVTGAAGNIGTYFAEHSHRRYELRLMVRPLLKDLRLSEAVSAHNVTDVNQQSGLRNEL